MLTGKILEENLINIRKSPENTELIAQYLSEYKQYYSNNIYENKTNDNINPSIYSKYNTPKNYLLNFDSQGLKINLNIYSKYETIFETYIQFNKSTSAFLVKPIIGNLNDAINKFNIYYNSILIVNNAQTGGCYNKVNQDVINDNYFNYINLKTGNITEKSNKTKKIYREQHTETKCDISDEFEEIEDLYEDINININENDGNNENDEKTDLTIINLLAQIHLKSLILLIKILLKYNNTAELSKFDFTQHKKNIMDYSLSTIQQLISDKYPSYSIYKYSLPIIYNLLNYQNLTEILRLANNEISLTPAKYTKIILEKRESKSINYYKTFSDGKYNYTIDLNTNIEKENKSLYNKFFHDLNKISIVSNDMLDDIELIKNTWINLNYKICLLENIVFYYSFIFYRYYGDSNTRQNINEKICEIIFHNIKPLTVNLNNDTKSATFSNDHDDDDDDNNGKLKNDNTLLNQLQNLFFDPLSFGLCGLFFDFSKDYCILLDWIKIINMVLNDNYSNSMMLWNNFTLMFYKSEEHFHSLNLNNLIIFNRYYSQSTFKVNNDNIICQLENYYYTDNINNSSNIYGSCINTVYNPISNFIALMKSNSYQNIKPIYPFIKYGFLSNTNLNIANQIINYDKINNKYVIGNFFPENNTNPNCLENTLIEKQKNNQNFKNILLNYIDNIKNIEKQDAQHIFYNIFSIINLYYSNDESFDMINIFQKLGFPSNLYSIESIEQIESNCYFKIISIFNNLIYFFYRIDITIDEKKLFGQYFRLFLSIIEQIKIKNKSSDYSTYCGESKINPDYDVNDLNEEIKYIKSDDNYEEFINFSKHELTNIDLNNFIKLKERGIKFDGNDIKKDSKKDSKKDAKKEKNNIDDLINQYTTVTNVVQYNGIKLKTIIIKIKYNQFLKINNKEFNIDFDFFDIIKMQLINIIADRYELVGLVFKDLLINENLYIRFQNDENQYISKGYRFYKNIHDKKIEDHVIVLKSDYSHNQHIETINNLSWETIENAHSKNNLDGHYLIKITYQNKEYNSRYSWKNFPNFIIYNLYSKDIRTKNGTLNYPMFLPYIKFIIKYDWAKNEKVIEYYNELTNEQKTNILKLSKTPINNINDLVAHCLKNKTQRTLFQQYLNGNRVEEWSGINKINGEKIKIINTELINNGVVTDNKNRVNNYVITLEENFETYEYIGIESILYGSNTLLKTLIEKLIEFNEFDTIDVWKKVTISEYLIKLNTYNINFLIDENLNIYIDNLNNLVLKDGDSNHEINKWVTYTNNLFITKNLTTYQYSLNLFDSSIGHKTVILNQNTLYPQIGTCNKQILNVIKNSYYNYKSNPDYNCQNILDLFGLINKFNVEHNIVRDSGLPRFNQIDITINRLFKLYELVNFPILTLNNVNDTDSDILSIINNILMEKNKINNFILNLKQEIDKEFINNSDQLYSSNYPSYLLIRLYSNNSDIYNKYFSFMFGKLSLKYFDLLKIGDYDNWNFFVNFYNEIKIKGFNTSPSELFYQFVYGFIAKPEQLELVNEVCDDICGKFNNKTNQIGGFDFKYIRYNNLIPQEPSNNGGRIHNLIMGGGKTSMVTPLAILRAYHLLNYHKKTDEAIYLILPSQLVYQSASALSQYLTTFFPIKVVTLDESRYNDNVQQNKNTFTNSLQFKNCNLKYNNLYILSDASVKCGFINDYDKNTQLIQTNSSSNRYIIDEIDTILNPLVSELNYPISDSTNQTELTEIENYFDAIFEVLYLFFNKIIQDEEINKLIYDNPNGFSLIPHFNVIDINFIDNIINIIKNKLINYYNDRNKNIYVKFLRNEINEEELFNLDNSIIESFYVLNNFINECIPTIFTMINRKNYGLYDGLTIVPFAYADTPSVGAEFSNPLIIMCLTIIDYIVQIVPLNDNVISEMINIIKNEYNLLSYEIRYISDIAQIYGEQLISLGNVNIFNATSKIKNLFRTNKLFLQKCLKFICKKSIKIFKQQLNITGVDLVMYNNIKYKSGFTGTPNIANFYDINPNDKMQIVPINPKLSETINNAILQALSIIKINITFRTEYLTHIFAQQQIQNKIDKICVLIDVGGVFAGINTTIIFDMIINVNPNISNLLYWNDNNIPKKMKKINGKYIIYDWNLDYEPNSFYYYDHKHTTGTDAKIPIGSIGIAIIGKDDRYRDVAQAIFRMRKLTKGHHIIFILDEKIYNNITQKINISIPMNNQLLLDWFIENEINILNEHQKVMNLYNIRSLFKILGRNVNKENFINNSYLYSRLSNTYKVFNKFYYPDKTLLNTNTLLFNYINGFTTTDIVDIKNIYPIFNINETLNKIYLLLTQNFGSNSLAISQNMQLTKNLNLNINMANIINYGIKLQIPEIIKPDFIINIKDVHRYINIKLMEKDNNYDQIPSPNVTTNLVNNYYYVEPRLNSLQNQYIAKNFYYYFTNQNELLGYWLYKYEQNEFYLIPLIEGIKLVDLLEFNIIDKEIFANVDIYDTEGNIIYTQQNNQNNYELNCIYSYIRFMTKMFDPNKQIFLSDFYNLLFMDISKLKSLLEKYDSIVNLSRDIHVFFEILKTYVELSNDNINQIKLAIDNFSEFSEKSYFNKDSCMIKFNTLKSNLNFEISDIFENIINFFTYNKSICYKLSNNKLYQYDDYYKSKYIKYKMKYFKLKKI